MKYSISQKKAGQLELFNGSSLIVGEEVFVQRRHYEHCTDAREDKFTVVEVGEFNSLLRHVEHGFEKTLSNCKISRNEFYVGADPFPKETLRIDSINFTLESLISSWYPWLVGWEGRNYKTENGNQIFELSTNPVILKNGKPTPYQRELVWTLEDKQMLISSIYNSVSCGLLLVRKRSFEELDKLSELGVLNVAFKDLVDGKQRISTIVSFMIGEFSDEYGNKFGDLSNYAQRKFLNHNLFSYAEIPENTPDDLIIKQFLKVNFSGKPQSKEHIDYVKSLLN